MALFTIDKHSRLAALPVRHHVRLAVVASLAAGLHALVEFHTDPDPDRSSPFFGRPVQGCSFRGAWPSRAQALAHLPALVSPSSVFEIHPAPTTGGAK